MWSMLASCSPQPSLHVWLGSLVARGKWVHVSQPLLAVLGYLLSTLSVSPRCAAITRDFGLPNISKDYGFGQSARLSAMAPILHGIGLVALYRAWPFNHPRSAGARGSALRTASSGCCRYFPLAPPSPVWHMRKDGRFISDVLTRAEPFETATIQTVRLDDSPCV